MNIQIFGTKKCFDTKKAERYFKERGIKYQLIDMKEKGMSKGEFNNVKQAVGGTEKLIDDKCRDKDLLALLNYLTEEDRDEKILENPKVIKTPVVRNGKKATIGYCPDVWKKWE
ncbi:MAG: arsenate reductase family protein [Ruminococcus sp.]|nr:arsenate reductase family protein [Ruminococcus sp.]